MKYRTQVDFEEQAKLNCVGTSFEGVEDLCRHELEPETDLNRLLRRYSPFELPMGQTFYGERDYDLDNAEAMHQLHALREQALAKWQSMSDEERAPWPTVGAFLTAVQAPVKPSDASVPATAQTVATGAGTASPVPTQPEAAKA